MSTELSWREKELIAFAAHGMTSKEVSQMMSEWWKDSSITAIDQCYAQIFDKLDVKNRHGLVSKAVTLGIIKIHDDGKVEILG
jgi:DNA-binding NarL/FixJ family response regulator